MKNRDIINGFDNKKFIQFISHMDCSCCAYYAADPESEHVCTKLVCCPTVNQKFCIEGMEKWLDQEDDWQLLNM